MSALTQNIPRLVLKGYFATNIKKTIVFFIDTYLMITFHHLKVFSVLESILVDSVRLQSKALHLQCFRQAEFDPGHEE